MSFFRRLIRIALSPLSLLAKLVTPKTPRLGSVTEAEQVYDARNQQNISKLGDPQAVIYGNVWRYPELSAQPWSEYDVNGDQVLHLRMRVTVGIASLQSLRIGRTPISSFAGTSVQLLRPGEPLTLFEPNVYANSQVESLEIVGGALLRTSVTSMATFGGSGTEMRINNQIDTIFGADYGLFAGAVVGGTVTVSGNTTPADNGTFTITAVGPGALPTYIDTSHTFTSATQTATISFDAYDLRDNDAPRSADVALTWSAATSSVTVAPTMMNPNDLSKFQIGDQIRAITSGAGSNNGSNFTILDISGDGYQFVLTPAPANATGITTVILLRRYHGPFDVCPPGDRVDRVAFDLAWPAGIGSINPRNGRISNLTMRFDLQWRPVDDGGVPLADWTSFDPLVVTANSRKAYRRSYAYTLPSPQRVQLRLALVSKDNTSENILDSVTWTGARGYVVAKVGEDPRIDVDCTTLNVSIRASGQLAQGDDRKVNGRFQRWLQTYDPATGTWSDEEPTSLVAWAALDKLRGPYTMRGRAVPDSEIDLDAFAALAGTGAEFHGSIETIANLRDNLNDILRLARGVLRYDWTGGKIGVYRDAPVPAVQLFCDLNSRVTGYKARRRTSNEATGVQVTYQQADAAEERTVGIGDTDGKPVKIDLRNGCTSRDVAWREANYEWNLLRFRNKTATIEAELEPIALRYGDRLLIQSTRRGWGQAAEIVSRSSLTLQVWPPLRWEGSGHYVILRAPDGQPGAAIPCTRGAADHELVLASAPDVDITGDDTGEQRTLLAFGQPGNAPRIAIVNGVDWRTGDNGGHQASIPVTIEDDRVHADPGATPADPNAVVTTPPNLTVTGLSLSSASGIVTASYSAVATAVLYEVDWQYAGDFNWTNARRGTMSSASFPIPSAGVVNVRVRVFGPGGTVGGYTQASTTVTAGTGGAGALAVSVSPTSLNGTTTSSIGNTGVATGSASGGTPGYTALWQQVSGGAISAANPTSLSTNFGGTGFAVGETRTAVYRLRITDAASAVAYSANVTITITNIASGGTPGGGGGVIP